MIKNFIGLLLFVILLLNANLVYSIENKILFKILNKSFTSIDYENRREYLLFVGDNNELSQKEIMDDFISVNLFNEYYLNSKSKFNLDENVNKIFKEILDLKQNKREIQENITLKENIFQNLRLDLIRKNILEMFLDQRKNEIFNLEDEITLIYSFKISYINILSNDFNNIKDDIDFNTIRELSDIEILLKKKNIFFDKNYKEINDFEKIDNDLKNNILQNNNFFILDKNEFISIIFIEKTFTTYDGLIFQLVSFNSREVIENKYLKCNYIDKNNSNFKIIKKNYEYNKLNKQIRNNLKDRNDFIEIENQGLYTYVVLCGIKFDKDLVSDININKKINFFVNRIEDKFIKKYRKDYKLIINE